MAAKHEHPVLRSKDDYQRAIQRAAELRESGAAAEADEELAALEGAIARYVAKPGEPGSRRGRPKEGGDGM